MNPKMTIFELVDAKVAAEARLYNECFDLGRYAGEAITKTKYDDIAQALGVGQARIVEANDLHIAAQELRAELLAKTHRINEEFDRVKQQRQEALELALDPDVTTEAKLQAVMATSEQLVAMAELSLATGDDDGVLLVLRVARQDADKFETVEQRIRAANPALNEICAELDFIDELPDYDPDDTEARFNTIAAGAPSREEFLGTLG